MKTSLRLILISALALLVAGCAGKEEPKKPNLKPPVAPVAQKTNVADEKQRPDTTPQKNPKSSLIEISKHTIVPPDPQPQPKPEPEPELKPKPQPEPKPQPKPKDPNDFNNFNDLLDSELFHAHGIQPLINQNKFQEAIWKARREGLSSQVIALMISDLESKLDSDDFTIIPTLLRGVAHKDLLKYRSGITGIFKKHAGTRVVSLQEVLKDEKLLGLYAADAYSEVAGYQLDRRWELDTVPVTRFKSMNGELGSVQYFIEGAEAGIGFHAYNFINMAILDFIGGNSDRNSGNFLYLADNNQIIAIDHGLSFRSFEGGCIFNSTLLLSFAARRRCPTIEELQKLYPGLNLSIHEMFDLEASYYRKTYNFIDADLSKLDPHLRNNILKETSSGFRSAFESIVYPIYLEKMINRVISLQNIL